MSEQRRLINITDEDVVREYTKQTGGEEKKDIEMLASLKLWRKRGWDAAGQHFKIKGFAELDRADHEQIKRAIYINLGVGLGFFLPDSAMNPISGWPTVGGNTGQGRATVTMFTCRATQSTVQFASPGVANSR